MGEEFLPVDDEGLEDIAEELGGSPEEEPHDPDARIKGLIIADKSTIKALDLDSKKVTEVYSEGGSIDCLAFHDGTLWFGENKKHNRLAPNWVSSVIDLKTKAVKTRGGIITSLFEFNGDLYDAGRYGIAIDEGGYYPIGTRNVVRVYKHKDKLFAMIKIDESPCYAGYEIGGELAIGIAKDPAVRISGVFPAFDAVSAGSHLVSTSSDCLSVDWTNKRETAPSQADAQYLSLAYDKTRNLVYASGDNIGSVDAFKLVEGGGSVYAVERKPSVIDGLGNSVRALLPVTQSQLNTILRQKQ
jgi:hypothetical protein